MALDRFNDGETSPGLCGLPSWRLAFQLFLCYKWEWLMCVAMQALGGLPQVFLEPHEAPWSLQDPSLQWAIPDREDPLVPSIVLLTVYGAAGIVAISLIPVLAMPWRGYLNIREVHHLALTYFYAVCLETLVRGLLNLVRGGLRPDFYALCQPNITAWQPGLQPVCTSGADLDNGRRSFPCGHCSFSCAGGILFTLHLLALFNYWGGQGRIWQFVLALAPSLGAWLISVSRISDGRHHGTDVVFGVLIGTISAYHSFFPSIFSTGRGKPLCVRDTLGMPTHLIHRDVTAPRTPIAYDAVGANLQEMPSTAETPASTARTVAI